MEKQGEAEARRFGDPIPAWITSLLENKLNEPCRFNSSHNKFFCTHCEVRFCKDCDSNHLHDHHTVLQVYKASHQAALKVNAIEELFNISSIQTYSFNHNKNVFIYKRRQDVGNKAAILASYHSETHSCKVCGWDLIDPTTFCSVECMVSDLTPKRKRKRGRKGIPRRAPFF